MDTEYGKLRVKQNGRTLHLPQWETGTLQRLYIRYRVDPEGLHWRSLLDVQLAAGLKAAGGKFSYRRAQATVMIERWLGPMAIHLRGFGGEIFGGSAPLQDAFYLDSSAPAERWTHGILQNGGTSGGVTFYRIGGGNLRGYVNQPLAGTAIRAATVELRLRLPLVPYRLAFFGDFGRLQSFSGSWLSRSDAGVSLVLDDRANSLLPIFNSRFQFRIDLPVYVSHPIPGEPRKKVRWMFGLRFQ